MPKLVKLKNDIALKRIELWKQISENADLLDPAVINTSKELDMLITMYYETILEDKNRIE